MNSPPLEGDCHFTYLPPLDRDLQQGDVIAKNDHLSALLAEIHPHYEKKRDYTSFVVLTQSCDLVRRKDDQCKAKYVSLAAVRSLESAVRREINKYQDELDRRAGVCSRAKRSFVEQFVTRVLNNNEPEYFYLEAEPSYGLPEPSCVFLRLSIALRAHQHYAMLRTARLISLAPIFQAKLGWLIGNMYSRVGTPDWAPDHLSEPEFQQKVTKLLDETTQWIDADQLKLAKKKLPTTPDPATCDPSVLLEHITGTTPPKKKDRALDAIIKVALAQSIVAPEDAQRLRTNLQNDPELATILK